MAYAGEARDVLVAGLEDGSLHAWDATTLASARAATAGVVHHHRAQGLAKADWRQVTGGGKVARTAHADRVTCLAPVRGGAALASRSLDGATKVWDVRALSGGPVITLTGLPCTADTTGVAWSPDGRLLVVACGGERAVTSAAAPSITADPPPGHLAFIDVASSSIVRRVGVPGDAVAVAWPARINQIFVGTSAPRGGRVRALYDPARSRGGVADAAGRRPRAPSTVDYALPTLIVAPAAETRGGRGGRGGAPTTGAPPLHRPRPWRCRCPPGPRHSGPPGRDGGHTPDSSRAQGAWLPAPRHR